MRIKFEILIWGGKSGLNSRIIGLIYEKSKKKREQKKFEKSYRFYLKNKQVWPKFSLFHSYKSKSKTQLIPFEVFFLFESNKLSSLILWGVHNYRESIDLWFENYKLKDVKSN